MFQCAAAQFMKMGVIQFDEKSASAAAPDEAVFSDAYLQGILFGLCKSLEIRNPKLKQTNELITIYGTLVMKLAGQRAAARVILSSVERMRAMDREFMDGTINGYGEGLTVQSLQKNEPVLLKHLQRLTGHA
jgi:hypothetical protein